MVTMEPKFEDILHLVSWNGYSEDIRQALAVNKETWTDDRLWFPFGIAQKFGKDRKGRLQIIIKGKNYFMDDKKTMARLEELMNFADGHLKKFLLQEIDARDANGESALTAAIENRCFNVVKFLLTNGADPNQVNTEGRSALNLAKKITKNVKNEKAKWGHITSVPKSSELIVEYLTELGAVDIPAERSYRMNVFEWLHSNIDRHYNFNIKKIIIREDIVGRQDEHHLIQRAVDEPKANPKAKRMKASLYKQQFRR
jgi:hypothetical protein